MPLVWDDCPNNIGFIQIEGNKEATDAAFAKAAHVVKHHFVINRVTAATMEPRGCIGIFEPIEGRYTIYTTLQRTNVFQTELSQYRAESARQQDPRRLRRYRRQLRHEVRRLQRSGAGAARRQS